MKPENTEFMPGKASGREEMKRMQREIAREAIFEDDLGFSPGNVEEQVVVGVDQAFTDERSVSAAVALKDGEVVEEVSASEKVPMPYIPGLLAFREGGAIIKALEKLDVEPDLLVLDGSGRIHFRQAGIATHIGVIFHRPTVGVAKNLLCGQPREDVEGLKQGEKVEIAADEKVENLESGAIGYAYQSRQYENSNRINPLYVSPGHRTANETAVGLTGKLCSGYKLPEPTRLADRKVGELKEQYR